MSETKPGDDVSVEIRSPMAASRVTVNGQELPVKSYTIEGSAGDVYPVVTLEVYRKNQDPIVLSGKFVVDKPGESLEVNPLKETVPE